MNEQAAVQNLFGDANADGCATFGVAKRSRREHALLHPTANILPAKILCKTALRCTTNGRTTDNMQHDFGYGEFFLVRELVEAEQAGRPLDDRSVCVIGTVQTYDHIKCRVQLNHGEHVLVVDTTLIGPCPFHTGWRFQFIGELGHEDNVCALPIRFPLSARQQTRSLFEHRNKFVMLGWLPAGGVVSPRKNSDGETAARLPAVHRSRTSTAEFHGKTGLNYHHEKC